MRELTLRVEDEVLIREHTIGGRPCLPTDALLDLVYRHAAERLGPAPLRIRDVTLYTPLFCEPGETKCLTVVDEGNPPNPIAINVCSSVAGGDSQRHLTAFVERENSARPITLEPPHEPAHSQLDGASLYQPGQTLNVGEFFRSLHDINFWPQRARAQLSLSKPAGADRTRFALHPGILDGFFGLAGSLAIKTTSSPDSVAYVPVCIQDVQVFELLGDAEYQADLRVTKTSDEYVRFDGELINQRGEVAIAIRGLDHRRISGGAFTQSNSPAKTPSKLKLKEVRGPHAPTNNLPKPATCVSAPSISKPLVSSTVRAPQLTMEHLQTLLASVLLCSPEAIDPKRSLVEQGVDSILGLEFVQRVNREFSLRLQGTILFEHPTLDALAAELCCAPANKTSAPAAQSHVADQCLPTSVHTATHLQNELTGLFAQTLLTNPKSIQLQQSLIEQGADSILGLEFVQSVNRKFGLRLPGTVLFENPTIESLSVFIANQLPQNQQPSVQAVPDGLGAQTESPQQISALKLHSTAVSGPSTAEIAVIGMAGRFPGAQTLTELWDNLAANRYLIGEVPIDHWNFRPYFRPKAEGSAPQAGMYCNRGGFLSGVDQFDPLFFNISPREAETMDPQLRIFLEVLWETFEDAGYAARIRGTRTGLYLGNCYNDYLDLMKQAIDLDFQFAGSGNSNSMLSNRASFFFDLTGPCLTLDTACSSSLVAMHLAIQALRRGECDMAIAGGVNLNLSPAKYLNFCAIGAFSHSGEIRPFSSHADGYLPGEGVAALLLKPLSAALRDGDRIHGLVRGSAVRCAGRSAGPTVPNPALETETLIDAWRDAQIAPETLTYLEAHGTGTKIGDPLEINAIKRAFATFTNKEQFCHLGTIKANFGHTEATAGLAGVIKVLLQMSHQAIAGMPNLLPLNPMIETDHSPLIIRPELRPWTPLQEATRRAGVSSFGMGGTYAHVVLEEFRHPESFCTPTQKPQKLSLSARTKEALRESAHRLAVFLDQHPDVYLNDVAYTLRNGRERMEESFSIT
ncbi:MAG: polyketide synthase dehydratase domain-containing protein, partial [Acidobacteriaceae bacterium]|nr:polyketide synthase dehydratase domain-containing protein [Acidobacteriaceae bacterium]